MRSSLLAAVLIAAASAGCASNSEQVAESSPSLTASAATTATTATTQTTPATTATSTTSPEHDCFWSPGITRGANNTQYPDANATYWYSAYTVPVGATVRLNGSFAHARYQSFGSYAYDLAAKEVGVAVDVLADIDITPHAGSTNPFQVGARRDAVNRRYTVTLQQAGVPSTMTRAPNVLYTLPGAAPQATTPAQQEIIYRVYVPDHGRDLTGDSGLPTVEVTLADGAVIAGSDACAALHADPSAPANGAGLLSADTYRQLVRLGDANTHPAQNPPTWLRFFNPRFNLLASFWSGTHYEEQIAALDRSIRKGFYANINTDYGVAAVNRAFGDGANDHNVLVLRGTAPTTPRTGDGQPLMTDAQVRYWSICQNESPVTTRVSDCLYDEQIPIDADGIYTVVVSLAQDRPSNATAACGVAWMAWGNGDGVDRPQAGTLILRHMLPAATFTNTWARVAEPGTEAAVLGPYLPHGEYRSQSEFEQRGCPATKK